MIGQQLGPYQVLSKLGAGGMGEVYRATDTRLNRTVAIKAMHATGALDPDHVARFEREAQLLASLNHPNIAAIHGLESVEATTYLVLEFVEGRPLSDVLREGAMPIGEALPIARQIADALAATHERGIIHRDLKPGNVMVTPDGQVKVLDFGLGKTLDPSSAADATPHGQANSPTMTLAATQAGIILGTAGYMSPEQAKGRNADKRSDVWAFGCVLFEMLSGRRAFDGEDITETLAAIVRGEPDWAALPATTPPAIRTLIERCLVKNRAERLPDMSVVKFVLNEPATLASPVAPVSALGSPRAAWTVAGVMTIAAVLTVGLWLWQGGGPSPDASGSVMRVSVQPFAGLDAFRNIAAASDDRFVVYQGDAGVGSMLYLHDFESGKVRPLAGTEGADQPFLSPDGRWVGFRRGTDLMKLRLAGGDAVRICQVGGNFPGAIWTPENTIVFPLGWLQGFSSVSADGGEPVAVTTVNTGAGEKGHWWPRLLPDGRHALFTIWNAGGGLIDSDIAVVDLRTGDYRTLVRGADAWFLPPGYLVYYHAGSYQARAFDPDTFAVGDESVPVLEDATDPMPQGTNRNGVAISARGTAFYLTDQILPAAQFAIVGPGTAPEPLPFPVRAVQSFALSPDGQTLAASSLESGVFRMHLLNLRNGIDERLDLAGSNWGAQWKHDSSGIAFVSLRKGDFDIYFKSVSGDAPDGPILDTPTDEWPFGWSADEASFFFMETQPNGSQALKVRSESGTKEAVTIIPRVSLDSLAISPDGRWLAYDDTRDGQENVYVRPYPGPGAEVRISPNGGEGPGWSPDGTELYYTKQNSILAVPFTASLTRFEPGAEQVLLTLPRLVHGEESPLVVRGRRSFIVTLREEAPAPPVLQVVLNWSRDVTARLAGR